MGPLICRFFSIVNATVLRDLHIRRANYKLDSDFRLLRVSVPLTPVLFKGQLYFNFMFQPFLERILFYTPVYYSSLTGTFSRAGICKLSVKDQILNILALWGIQSLLQLLNSAVIAQKQF